MKSTSVLFTALAFMFFTAAYSQQVNRTDICQNIPELSPEQQKKIDKLGNTHQKKMDDLRRQFQSESNAQNAALLKTQMNNEMQSHYRNISALLTPEQLSWYDQTCNVNGTRSYTPRSAYGAGFGRGQGIGRGAGYLRGTGNARGTAYASGAGYARGAGFARGAGYGKGTRPGAGRGRGRCIYW